MPPPRPDVGAKPDNIPPPVPNTPRPVQSSLHNRGSTLVPGAPRQPSPGPTPPPLPGNRGAAFGGGSTRQTPSGSSSPFSNRPPLPPTPSRALDDKPPPPPPPVGSRPSVHREAVPPPPPQNSKPPVPSTPRPSPSAQAPPPPPSRPGPPPVPPGSSGGGGGDEIPRLPQRNLSLSSSSSSSSSAPPLPSPGRSGPLPPPPSERPPPPVRDPPGRSGMARARWVVPLCPSQPRSHYQLHMKRAQQKLKWTLGLLWPWKWHITHMISSWPHVTSEESGTHTSVHVSEVRRLSNQWSEMIPSELIKNRPLTHLPSHHSTWHLLKGNFCCLNWELNTHLLQEGPLFQQEGQLFKSEWTFPVLLFIGQVLTHTRVHFAVCSHLWHVDPLENQIKV